MTEVLPIRETINQTEKVLNQDGLNRLKAAYCQTTLDLANSKMQLEEQVFKFLLLRKLRSYRPVDDSSWAKLYDELDSNLCKVNSG